MIYHKNPVEESFICWIMLNPDSFHHLDMKRFYVFVHSVIRYKATTWRQFEKFKSKVLTYKPYFREDCIEYFFNLMNQMIDFSEASYLPLYDIDDNSKLTVRQVVNGKLIITEDENS